MAIGFHKLFFVFSIHRLAENLAFSLPCKCNHSPDVQEEGNLICYTALIRDWSAANLTFFPRQDCRAVSWGPRLCQSWWFPGSRAAQSRARVTTCYHGGCRDKAAADMKSMRRRCPTTETPKAEKSVRKLFSTWLIPTAPFLFSLRDSGGLSPLNSRGRLEGNAWISSSLSVWAQPGTPEQGRSSCRCQGRAKCPQLWWPQRLQCCRNAVYCGALRIPAMLLILWCAQQAFQPTKRRATKWGIFGTAVMPFPAFLRPCFAPRMWEPSPAHRRAVLCSQPAPLTGLCFLPAAPGGFLLSTRYRNNPI